MTEGHFVFTLHAKRLAPCVMAALLFAFTFPVEAQESKQIAHIGFLSGSTPSAAEPRPGKSADSAGAG